MYKQYYEHGSPMNMVVLYTETSTSLHNNYNNAGTGIFVMCTTLSCLYMIIICSPFPNRIQYYIIMSHTEILSSVWFCNLSVMIIPCF